MESTKYTPVDISEEHSASQNQKLRSWLSRNEKWRIGLLYAAAVTSLVCVLNLIITIWAFATHGMKHGSAVLYEGSCARTKNLNIGIHLIVNIFGSAILGGSNYTMQCLSSPTRTEVDKAHSRGTRLDIGVTSIRNLSSITNRRKWLWILLGVSSIPLHLFYNSIVFTTLSANSYSVYVINEPWLSSANLTISNHDKYLDTIRNQLWIANQAGQLERLEPSNCIDEYARSFVSDRSNLLVVTSDPSNQTNESTLFDMASGGAVTITGEQSSENLDSYPWICGEDLKCLQYESHTGETYCAEYDFCNIDKLDLRKKDTIWKLNNQKVDYCLSLKTEEHCKLRLNATIAIIVILSNFLKAALISLTLLTVKEHLLLNMGDAINSFFEKPDEPTEGSCLLSRDDVTQNLKDHKVLWGTRTFHDRHRYWFATVSRRRIITVFTAGILGLLICIALLVYGVFSMKGTPPGDMWSLGFGQPSSYTLITFRGIRRRMIRTAGVLSNVLIANSPQTIISFLYFACNSLLTSMLLAQEWSTYAHTQKGLRVHTHPRGSQRTTYFLQLPWRYGLPMIAVSAILHWLASQSIFLVSVEWWENASPLPSDDTELKIGDWARDDFYDFATCGYSPLALFLFIVLASVFLLVLAGLGFRRFPSGMPVAGSCSLAIAAACHGDRNEEHKMASQMPLQWGSMEYLDGNGNLVRRCGFSSGRVEYPQEGVLYG